MPRPNQFDRRELIKILHEVADELGHSPSVSDINDHDASPCAKTFEKYFGSWNAAKQEAGLTQYDYLFGSRHDLTKVELVREAKRDESCEVCGEDSTAALTFHHPDNVEKVGAVSAMATNGYSRDEIREEISKCIVICANCHKRHHANYDPLEVSP